MSKARLHDDFWDNSDDTMTSNRRVTPEMVGRAEHKLGYALPRAYVALVQTRNGGAPKRTCYPTKTPTSWAEDHVQITGIRGIGGKWGVDSDELGSLHMIEEWGYPPIGIVVAECPSAGHDAIMLDYSKCGQRGEPQVVHVETECDEPRVTFLAKDFATFLAGLKDESEYDTRAEDLSRDIDRVERGAFSPLLADLCRKMRRRVPRIDRAVRNIGAALVREKKHFSLHADPLSYLMYDLQFWLYTNAHAVHELADYFHLDWKATPHVVGAYPEIVVFGAPFSTGGYGPGFVDAWLAKRRKERRIVARAGRGSKKRFLFTDAYAMEVEARVRQFELGVPELGRTKAKPARTKAKPARAKSKIGKRTKRR